MKKKVTKNTGKAGRGRWPRWTKICVSVMILIAVYLLIWFIAKGASTEALLEVIFDGLPAIVVVAIVWLIGLWVKKLFK